MFKRLSPAERQRRRIENEELLRRNRLVFTEMPLCARHGFNPPTPPGKLPIPASECPGCKREALRSRADPEHPLVKIPHPLEISKTPVTPRVELILEQWDERRRAAGLVAPGSVEEARALDRISDLRYEERQREESRATRGGTLAGARIEGGEWIEYRALPTPGSSRKRIIRCEP
jgi:hypothetical protein